MTAAVRSGLIVVENDKRIRPLGIVQISDGTVVLGPS